MSFAADRMQRAMAWFVRWWQSHSPEVPPELAACEFECTARSCDEQMFEGCENRLRHAAAIREAEAKSLQRPEPADAATAQPEDNPGAKNTEAGSEDEKGAPVTGCTTSAFPAPEPKHGAAPTTADLPAAPEAARELAAQAATAAEMMRAG
jgi:hypothetical protein